MARLETICFMLPASQGSVQTERDSSLYVGMPPDIPQIFWADGSAWREANLWLYHRLLMREVVSKTVLSNAVALLDYAKWLEATQSSWLHLPPREADRCIVRYRGALIRRKDQRELAPSTATARMRVIIAFYRWLHSSGLITTEYPLWQDRLVGVQAVNQFGFKRTFYVTTNSLRIPNRSPRGTRLEDGLIPVSPQERDQILELALSHASKELYLMLTLGFLTGLRLGTITDLKVMTLRNAIRDPVVEDFYLLNVGPTACPPVATKQNVSGRIRISKRHHQLLLDYAYSTRRLLRERKAKGTTKDLLFITSRGNHYTDSHTGRSNAITVEMHKLRKIGAQLVIPALQGFHFHQTRCTFATQLAVTLVQGGYAEQLVPIVMEALLHRSEQVVWRYISFAKDRLAQGAVADLYTLESLGHLAG